MKRIKAIKSGLIVIMAVLFMPSVALAERVDEIQFLKTSPQDGSAVVKRADGKMDVVKVGDSLLPGAKVVDIGDNRVVLEEKTGEGPGTVIISLEDGKQSVRRVKRHPGKRPLLYSPARVEIQNGKD
jgi:hypothetical protein